MHFYVASDVLILDHWKNYNYAQIIYSDIQIFGLEKRDE